MNAELHFRIVGILMLLLVAMNIFDVPRRFDWKREMAGLSLLNRQIFQVHAAFICIVLLLFAALTLLLPLELLEPTPLARAVLGGLALFWFLRLLTQWFVYDRRIWRGNLFYTVMHFVFTGVWIYFTVTFALALTSNFGRSL
jgi:hypothetical protein